jgi:two-component system, OmpR family, sensor kinase
MRRTTTSLDGDAAAVRRASRLVAVQITASAAVIVCLVVVLSVAFIFHESQPRELLEKAALGETKIYVDSGEVFIALVVVGAFAILVAGVLSWLVARRAVRPLGDALRIQRTFVADASHELRTPLAVLDARIQVLQRGLAHDHEPHSAESAGAELVDDVAAIRRDSKALIDVVNDLLLAAAADLVTTDGRQERDADVADVVGVVTETVESMRVLAAERGITIELETDASARLRAAIAATSLRRCVLALLDNALVHSPDGSTITVRVHAMKNSLDVVVADHGSGVQGIDPARIFDRFARASASTAADPDRTRAGFGIGLSLVRDTVVRHGGTVELRETSSSGTTIAFTLPRV